MNTKRLPDFLYIGASKAGSTWLFEILREHPEAFVPIAKATWFFDRYYDRGLDWYAPFFAKAKNAKAVGELSHDYFLSSLYADRIQKALPDIKVIACLREPGQWAISRYVHDRTTGVRSDVDFEQFVQRPDVVRQIDYLSNLKPFYDRFPRKNILVLFYDELCEDAGRFAREVFNFVGVDSQFRPPSLHRRILPARRARIETVGHISYRAAQVMRSLGLGNLVGAIWRNPLFKHLLFSDLPEKPVFAHATLRQVRDRFAPSYDALEQLIGRQLPSAWRSMDSQPETCSSGSFSEVA